MKAHTNPRSLALDYIALTLAAVLWYGWLLNAEPYTPPGPQTYSGGCGA